MKQNNLRLRRSNWLWGWLLPICVFACLPLAFSQIPVDCSIQLKATNQIELSWPAVPGNVYTVKITDSFSQPWKPNNPSPSVFRATTNIVKATFPIQSATRFFQVVTCCTPYLEGQWPGFMRANAYGLDVRGDYAFVAGSSSGLQIIDIRDSSNPIRVGGHSFPSTVWSVLAVSSYVYAATESSGLYIIDVSNPFVRTVAGRLASTETMRDVEVAADHAYIAAGSAGLRIVNLSNLNSPSLVTTLNVGGFANGLHVVSNFAYVASSTGLSIINVSNPAAPQILGSYNLQGFAQNVRVVNNLAYVADSEQGLQILDVSNPSNPFWVGSFITNLYALNVEIIDDLAVIAGWTTGLAVVSVANPSQPLHVGSIKTSGSAREVRCAGKLGYLADRHGGASSHLAYKPGFSGSDWGIRHRWLSLSISNCRESCLCR